ncbi:MAG TPA: hypothetical protein VFO55_11015 [Gemmatimonadaceae bacterium]|nr:hypothetical protein [Gemmatimonadaceae bacterium]
MIIPLLVAALHAPFQQTPPPPPPPTTRRPPQTVVRDSTPPDTTKGRRAGRRLPVTAELAASAFRNRETRELFEKARRARMEQDSAIRSYDATARQRMSVNLGIGGRGREHLFYRQESASRVRWQHDVGARIELTGARVGIPMASKKEELESMLGELSSISPIPYYPGYEALWIVGDNAVRAEANDRDIVNPLTVGAEAYYTYAISDSVAFTLQTGQKIVLREIEVRPRQPKWNLAVGSFWFDENGRLVKCVYRLSVPLDVWTMVEEEADSSDQVPAIVKGFMSPMRMQITAIAIEYSLMQGRFWLPRMRSMTGDALFVFARVPMSIEQRFEYRSVNADLDLPKIDSTKLPEYTPPEVFEMRADSIRRADSTRKAMLAALSPADRAVAEDSIRRHRDSVSARNRARRDSSGRSRQAILDAVADSLERGLPAAGAQLNTRNGEACDSTGFRTIYRRRFESRMPVAVRVPCDLNKLINSPDLPPSIYDSGEELFSTRDRDEMMKEALTLADQAPFSLGLPGRLPRPTLAFGLPMTRFNRVEGLSTGIAVDQQLGAGLSVGGTLRFGLSDKVPNVEINAKRSNLTKTIGISGYHRLAVANDWGNPLSFGSSFSALIFGKDEGFYYRATGADASWTRGIDSKVEWRLFAERHASVGVNTQTALVHRSSTDTFPSNVAARADMFVGSSLNLVHNHGLDPRGFRAFTLARLEGATSDSAYGRGALELNLSTGLPFRSIVGLTLSGGTSVGALPPQRRWYLGGTHTVRGQSADTAQSGNAYWLTRLELARDNRYRKSSLFADLGWAGDRNDIANVGRPLSGVGYGESIFDGIVRWDIARGLYPRKQWRFDVYLEARF